MYSVCDYLISKDIRGENPCYAVESETDQERDYRDDLNCGKSNQFCIVL